MTAASARLVPLDEARLADYRDYVAGCGRETDDYFTSPEQLAQVSPATETAALLVDRGERIVGVASLMPRRGNGGRRLRLIHADDAADYPRLVAWVREQVPGSYAEVFLYPPAQDEVTQILLGLGATQHKRSYGLSRELPGAAPGAPEEFEVRELTEEHDAAFVALWTESQAVRGEAVQTTVESVREARANGERVTYLAAFDGERLVATGSVEPDDDPAWLGTLSVAPSHRGRGLGRRMLRELAASAAAQGATKVELSVDGHNDNALGLYLAEGYTVDLEAVCLWIMGSR